jgi:tetratricopeptide (TPR) repeat protein
MSAVLAFMLSCVAVAMLCGCSDEPQSILSAIRPNTHGVTPLSAATTTAYLARMREAEAIEDEYTRCISAPDLPGNQWPDGGARARCSELQEGPWPIPALAAVLEKSDGGQDLDQAFQRMQEAYVDSAHKDARWERAFEAFDSGKPEAEVLAQTWLEQSSKSPHAMTALGLSYLQNAAKQRGPKWINETSQSEIDAMQRWLHRAQPLFLNALSLDPHQGFACSGLVDAIRMAGGTRLGPDIVERCNRADPNLPRYLSAIRIASTPKWGGSWEALASFDDYIEAPAQQNPALAYMRSTRTLEQAFELQRAKQQSKALPMLLEVVRVAPHSGAMRVASRDLQEAGRFDEAMIYLTQALRFEPRNIDLLNQRGGLYQALGDNARAIETLQQVVSRGLANTQTYAKLAYPAEKLGDYATARDAYEKAMLDPDYRQWAQTGRCDIIVRRENSVPNALACTEGLVSAFPADPMANFMRAWVLTKNGQPGAEEAAQRFFALPEGSDKRQQQMISELRGLRAGKGQ